MKQSRELQYLQILGNPRQLCSFHSKLHILRHFQDNPTPSSNYTCFVWNEQDITMIDCLLLLIRYTWIKQRPTIINIRTRKAGGLWRHDIATYGYKLTIHFHLRWFCDVTDRLLFVLPTYVKSNTTQLMAYSSLVFVTWHHLDVALFLPTISLS